jgi:hypothetical protein
MLNQMYVEPQSGALVEPDTESEKDLLLKVKLAIATFEP